MQHTTSATYINRSSIFNIILPGCNTWIRKKKQYEWVDEETEDNTRFLKNHKVNKKDKYTKENLNKTHTPMGPMPGPPPP